jgi:Rieske Fe-S protein
VLISRREALMTTGVALAGATIPGCATYGKPPPATATHPSTRQAVAKTADVPVGSGVIVDDLVITQPEPGTFNGFSAECTHAGCTVAEIVGASINCPCHGSRFNLDGTVAKGPATRPLQPKAIVVQDDSITLQ